MAIRTFEQWVDSIFDHPIVDPAWYWAADADTCVEAAEVNVEYLTRLFSESAGLLKRFDDAQVDQGLNMIVHCVCSDHAFTILNDDVPWEKRRSCIGSIYDLYAECFAARCAPGLSHCERVENPLNFVCYMWWDLFPGMGYSEDKSHADEDAAFLAVMERCLTIPHVACIEGALHGLGHWQEPFPGRVEAIINQFLRGRTDLPPELTRYALRARIGNVQ